MTAAADPYATPYPRRQLIRTLLRKSVAAVFPLLADFDIQGREHLPEGGPLVIAGNHFSFLDPVALIHITAYPLEFIGGRQAPNAPRVVGWVRNLWGILPVSRGGASRDALVRAQRTLAQNGVLGIFPEGGSWAVALRPPRPGAALLAARSGAPVLPVGLSGFTEVFKQVRRGKRARVTVRIGKPLAPFRLAEADRTNRRAIDEFGDQIMRAIAALLPPEQRGFYSDDPAVRAAAKGTEIYPWDDIVER